MGGFIDIEISTDMESLMEAIDSLGDNIKNVAKFVGPQIKRAIKYEVFNIYVRKLAAEAGNFPRAYTEHLVNFLQSQIPIDIIFSEDGCSINIPFSGLGDKEEFTLGYHDHALLGDSYDGGNWESIHVGHSEHDNQAQVILPWHGGEDDSELMSSKETRTNFWNQVIIGRDVEGFISGFGNAGIQAAMRNKILVGLPTYEQVAVRRVAAWVGAGVAPEWLLLEYGSPDGSDPVIQSVDFLQRIQAVCECIIEQAIDQATQTIMRIFDREAAAGSSVRVGRTGLPYKVVPGKGARFVKYADIRDDSPIDISRCVGV